MDIAIKGHVQLIQQISLIIYTLPGIQKHLSNVLYLEFQKTCDEIPYKRLLGNIKSHSRGQDLGARIEVRLIDNKQRVIFNQKTSDWFNVTCWVPQGSFLEPVLFIFSINDLEAGLTAQNLKIADDRKVEIKLKGRHINDLKLFDIETN